jgi:hypothetical protein
MSFDMFVFDPSAAPRDPRKFFSWFDRQTKWKDDYDYNEPTNCGAALQEWIRALVVEFAALNGPLAPVDDCDDVASVERNWTDYSVGESFIYVCFPSSKAERAKEKAHFVANSCGVGVFDVSEEPSFVTFPDGLKSSVSHGGAFGSESDISSTMNRKRAA